MEQLQTKIEEKVLEAVIKAEEVFKQTFPMPEIRFDIKHRSIAGKARPRVNILFFNMSIAHKQPEEFVKSIVVHEVAHLIAYQIYKDRRPKQHHGPEWKSVMRELGEKPEVYHHLQTEPRKRYKRYLHLYICSKCGQKCNYSSRTHNRIQKAGEKYWSCHCGGTIKYVETYSV